MHEFSHVPEPSRQPVMLFSSRVRLPRQDTSLGAPVSLGSAAARPDQVLYCPLPLSVWHMLCEVSADHEGIQESHQMKRKTMLPTPSKLGARDPQTAWPPCECFFGLRCNIT